MNKYKLSICIPNFNRSKCLNNCLNSILIAKKNYDFNFEVCISDNCSEIDIKPIVEKYKNFFKIKYNKNSENLGLGVNILRAVSLADGEFVWILGNDDLILPNTFKHIDILFRNNERIDFYYINSFHLNSSYVFQSKQPFDTSKLPTDMEKFSKFTKSFESNFFDLINYKISFDFILGMFLAIFRKKIWDDNLFVINKDLIEDKKVYSNFHNTAPHVLIWASGFTKSRAYFQAEPLSINLYGEREWFDLYPFVESFRIPDVLKYYRKSGLNLMRYFLCMNFANRKFLINLFKIFFLKKYKGKNYLNFFSDILPKFFYPYVYIAFLYYSLRKIFKLVLK